MFKSDPPYLTRRGVLVTGLAVGGGLAVGYALDKLEDGDVVEKFGRSTRDAAVLNGWVKVTPDNRVIIAVPRAEMGQGITTSLPMILADELGANWEDVSYEFAPLDKDYFTAGIALRILDTPPDEMTFRQSAVFWGIRQVFGVLGLNITGGSTSIVDAMYNVRPIGAAARGMLTAAAAEAWDVPEAEIVAANSRLSHAPTGQSASFGEMAEAAAKLSPPREPDLKDSAAFDIIGTSPARLDIPAKTDGSAGFGIDVRQPDQLFAALKQAPQFGAKVGSFDPEQIADLPGVVTAVKVADNAVAVVAGTTHQAYQAIDQLDVTWVDGPEPFSSAEAFEDYEASFDGSGPEQPPAVIEEEGDITAALAGGEVIEATYRLPFLAHATMETQNTTVLFKDGQLKVWSPTQSTTVAGWAASRAAGDEVNAPNIDVMATYMGGGFGRRAEEDFARLAAAVAMQVPGRPVQLIWSREEDTQHDFYRPMFASRFRAVLNEDGLPAAWDNTVVAQSVSVKFSQRVLGGDRDPTEDAEAVSGATKLPYALPNRRISYVTKDLPVPVGNWRSVGNSAHGFLTESFMDELAVASGQDPVAYRRTLLQDSPAELGVLDKLAEVSNWDAPLSGENRGRGVAIHSSYGSIVGQVVEVTVESGEVRVDRVVCVCDPRQAVHPDTIVAQMEGSIIMGLSSALYEEITIEDGAVVQSNFYDYEILKMAETPEIEVHLLPQGGLYGGAGEPGLPPTAPALTSAIFNATGVRIRELPVIKTPLVGV